MYIIPKKRTFTASYKLLAIRSYPQRDPLHEGRTLRTAFANEDTERPVPKLVGRN